LLRVKLPARHPFADIRRARARQKEYAVMAHSYPSTARSLPIALLRARERVMGPIRSMLADDGITEQQWRVLRVLDEAGPIEPTHIAQSACLLLPSLTRILQKREQKGLIARVQNEDDRRRQTIRISDRGAQLIAAHLDRSVRIFDELRMQLGADRYDLLLDLLNELDQTPATAQKTGNHSRNA